MELKEKLLEGRLHAKVRAETRKERSNSGSGKVPKVELETASLEPKFSPPAIRPTTHLLS